MFVPIYDSKWSPAFEWCINGCEFNNGYQENIYVNHSTQIKDIIGERKRESIYSRNLDFDNECTIHASYENYETNGYGQNLNLLTI